MNIQLKQTEIVQALKVYLAQQGISTIGKHVTATFTSGRKGMGTSVEVVIEDVEIPGFTEDEPLVLAPALATVTSFCAAEPVGSNPTDPVDQSGSATSDPVDTEAVAEEVTTPKITNSLFG